MTNSFDIFDTLVGRWYIDDHEYKVDQDFQREVKHTFPIVENVQKMTDDCLIISDTYFTKEQLVEILTKNRITKYKNIICSYDGKWTGRIWGEIRPDSHTGDNKISDFDRPSAVGIPSNLYTNSQMTSLESILISSGFPKLAGLSRATRLSNPFSDNINLSEIWTEQANINLPILVMISNYLSTINGEYDKFLFTQRDCCNLYPLFTLLYPDINSDKFFTSRDMYSNPTDNFIKYTSELVTEKSLIVDLQGTGRTCQKYFNNKANYFTVVYSDLDNILPVKYLLHRKDGFTDRIERLNYDLSSKITNVVSIDNCWHPVCGVIRNGYIHTAHLCNGKAREFIQEGFQLEKEYSSKLLILLLRCAEQSCKICQYVNHEEI